MNNSSANDSLKKIIGFTSVLSLGTLTSRVLGFVRDILLAKILGTGLSADVFFVSFKIPNLLRSFVGEGAVNSVVVPVYSEYQAASDRSQYDAFVSLVFSAALAGLGALTMVGMILSPWLVIVIAPGFIDDPAKWQLSADLTRLMFPYLIFIGLSAYSMGYLYVQRLFFVPAFAPCLLNMTLILGALAVPHLTYDAVFVLAACVLLGGLLQLGWHLGAMIKTGFTFTWQRNFNHPGLLKTGRLLVPRMLGSGVYQITVLIDTICASLAHIVGAGGISAIYYANRIIFFPIGLFGISLASASLPRLSTLAVNKDLQKFKETIVFSLEALIWIMALMTVLLLALAEPIIHILFERGQFDRYSTQITSTALFFYAFGLIAYAGIKILVAGFYALQDTKTPVYIAAGCLVVNAVLNVILMFPLKIGGIALASSIASSLHFGWLYYLLQKRLHGWGAGFGPFLIRVTSVSVITGLGIVFLWQVLPGLPDWLRLGIVGLSGCLLYWVLSFALRIHSAEQMLAWLKDKFQV